MNKLITFTRPELIEKQGPGLFLYRFELHGLIESVNYTVKKTLTQAKDEAKNIIFKYLERNEVPLVKKKFISKERSGWVGITFDEIKQRWRVTVLFDKKTMHVGHYIKKSTAIREKRKANVKHGLPEFYGMKKIILK